MSIHASASIKEPLDITVGSDSRVWFTNIITDSIGRIAANGVARSFPAPAPAEPAGITAGPDRAPWFTEPGQVLVVRQSAG